MIETNSVVAAGKEIEPMGLISQNKQSAHEHNETTKAVLRRLTGLRERLLGCREWDCLGVAEADGPVPVCSDIDALSEALSEGRQVLDSILREVCELEQL